MSVVVPVHDRAGLIGAALRSVAAQDTDARVEVVVVDDASSDSSAEVAGSLGATVVRLATNGGPSLARNAGIEAASGEWVAFLDSDDRWAPTHLSTLLAASAGAVLVGSSALSLAGGRRRALGPPILRPRRVAAPGGVMRPENALHTSSAMARTDALRATGGFGTRRWSEDLELWLRLASRGPVVLLPDITVFSLTHEGQTSSLNSEAMATSAHDVLAESRGAGLLTDRDIEAFETVLWWDGLRRDGRPALALRRPDRFGHLTRLLGSRAAQRHRWRLQPAAVAAVTALS